ncbi:LacI family DNA-binding transcriptional regulator [Eubacterium multiforme]|uniref:LacI family transcriptional regulator n=1 Tax=Eubacterium multiforme TaxID=83339 RepID=A0ABT9UT48_9FIRM|nr:LacI family DNA-binding transcriptional regulator [Eubacterium multiforme]MDQ0149454.1 LacI family transcriptional regulator [Eubacterium multiforme]
MKVTIKDVAKEANVAPSTVSRVISNSHKISEETKAKVNKAIKKLNYTPNVMARGLVSNKTRILGVVLPNEAADLFSNPFFVEAMKGMSIGAEENGYYIMYAFSKNEEDELKGVKEFTSSNLLDGICLLTARENDKCINYLKEINFPFVVVGRPDDDKNILWVDNDNFKAMYNLVNKLIKEGHNKIGFIGAKKDWKVSKYRLNGYKDALRKNKIPFNKDIVMEGIDFTEECGYDAMKKILKDKSLDAVVTTEDLLAIGANKFLLENKIKNIKVIGFNNTPMTKYQNPPIASIDINATELGYEATNLLISTLNGKRKNKTNYHIVETKFIER